MNKREKIEQIYQKNNIKVSKEYIDNIMKDTKRVQMFMERYEQVPDIITGKDLDYLSDMFEWNKEALKKTNDSIPKVQDEEIKEILKKACKLNLFKKKVIRIAKIIWDNKDNPEQLEKFEKQIQLKLKEKEAV